MKILFNLGFGTALKRIFGGGKKAELQAADATVTEQAQPPLEGELETEAPAILTLWTIERNRYAAPRALCTEVEVYPSEAVILYEDIKGYVFDTPSGESVVVEAGTGSLVGHSLEVVRDGIREMTKSQLKQQLDSGKKEFNRMIKHELPNDEFWKAIRMGGAEIEVAQDYQE